MGSVARKARAMAATRTTWPSHIPGATRFSEEDGNFLSPLTLVSQIKGLAQVMRMLNKARVDHNHGRRRAPGNWALIYLVYIISRDANLEPWHRGMQTLPQVWHACGFREIPAYQTVWQRFVELEQFAQVFEEAARLVIQMARRRNPLIGAWHYVDGTEVQTHAKSHHACGPDDACPTKGHKRGPKRNRVNVEDAAALRQQGLVIDPADATRPTTKTSGTPLPPDGTREITEDGVRYVQGGHWWFSRDVDASTRAYKNNRVFEGYESNKDIDLVTHAPLAVVITTARVNEHDVLPELYDRACHNTGVEAVAVMADKGLAVSSVYDFLVERGVTPVMPTRENSKGPVADGRAPSPKAPCDMHGIPTCKHCGLPCDFGGFSTASGKARVWYRCPLPRDAKCRKPQSMLCSKQLRKLIPIWRTSPIYNVLRSQLGNLEHVHEDWRTRYRSGGKTLRDRQRRTGLACQQLRASAAMLVEWCWVMMRQGWLGTRRTERAQPVPLGDNGRYARLIGRRRKMFLLGGAYSAGKPPPGVLLPA